VLLDSFNVDEILQTICREQITFLSGVPRLFLGMLLHDEADRYDIRTLKFCITGGSTMPPQYIPEFNKKFHTTLVEGYGLTAAPYAPVAGRRPSKAGVYWNRIPAWKSAVSTEGKECPRVMSRIDRSRGRMKATTKTSATREAIRMVASFR
jgi:long-chain acyl-CoA synthetase